MTKPLAVLIVEDSESDAQLMVRLLTKAGYTLNFEQVEDGAQMRKALEKQTWEIVISDFNLPELDGFASLKILQETGLDIPFIVVSGTMGEETAVAMMKAGAHDYVMKRNLSRLPTTIERELKQAEERRDHKKAREKLLESEKRYFSIFNTNTNAISLMRISNNQLIEVNNAWEELTGFTRAEALGQIVNELIIWVEPGIREQMVETLRQQGKVSGETKIICKSGGIRFVAISAERIELAGEPYVLTMAQNITERRLAEEKNKENDKLLKIAGETAKFGGWSVDLRNNLCIWSDETAAILERPAGYSPFVEEGLSYFAPEWREKITKVFSECVQNGTPYDEEMEIITANGKRVWVRTIGISVEDEVGKIIGVHGSFQDISARKQVEETLKESEEKFRLSFMTGLDAIYLATLEEGLIIEANDNFESVFGFSRSEVIGQTSLQLGLYINPEDRARMISEIKKKGFVKDLELEGRKKGGEIITVSLSVSVIQIDSRQHQLGVIRDITERRKAEQQAKDLEKFQRTLLERMPVGMFIVEPTTRTIEYANGTALAMFGSDNTVDLVGHKCNSAVCLAGDGACPILDLAQEIDNSEREFICADGSRRPILKSVLRVQMQGKEKLLECFVDITERKRAESELIKAKEKAEEQEKFVKGILDNLQDAFFQADLNGCITYVNPTAQKMYGYSYDELIGKKTEMLYAEPRAREKLLAALRQFEKLTDWNSLGLRKDGSSFWVSMNVQFIKDNSGKIIGTEGVIRDITERKQAEIALRESEVKFQQMFDISPVGIVLVGLDKRFNRCNLAFSQSLGYGTEELVGKLITDITFSEDIHIGMTEMMAILKGEIAQSQVQKRYLRKEGQIIWGEATISLLRDSEGCAQYFLAIIQDITERKKAEEALVDNERKYRTLFESADDAILLFTDDQWVDCNAAALRVFGCTREQIIGSHPRRFSPPTQPDGRSSEELSVERIRLTFSKKPQTFEWVHCRADGTLFNAEVHLNRVDLEDKPFIQAIVRDVSERKQAEQDRLQAEDKVRESEELFRTAFESSVAGISMIGPDGNFIRVNNKFCEIVGYKKEELFCLKFNDITYEKDMEVGNQYLKQMVAGELESTTVEKRYIKKNGNVIWVLLSIAAIRNKQKELQFFVTYTKDITEQKEAIEKLKLMVENTIRTIALIVEARDPYTSGHQIRVAEISVVIAKELNLPDEQIQGIYYACLIHDLGKIQVPAEILSNPRKLTNLEFELIKTHPIVGYELIKDIDFPWPIAEMVYQHHERLDGSGYPRHLKGNRISIEAKIIGVADVIEAMSSHRPYRPALGLEAALEEINKNKGVLYDKDVVEAFNKVIKNDKTLFPTA